MIFMLYKFLILSILIFQMCRNVSFFHRSEVIPIGTDSSRLTLEGDIDRKISGICTAQANSQFMDWGALWVLIIQSMIKTSFACFIFIYFSFKNLFHLFSISFSYHDFLFNKKLIYITRKSNKIYIMFESSLYIIIFDLTN